MDGVLKGTLQKNLPLIEQAASDRKVRFSDSPDPAIALTRAIMDSLEAHTTISPLVPATKEIQDGLSDMLLGAEQPSEALCARLWVTR